MAVKKNIQSILGFHIAATSGVALYYDGSIQFASSEERYTRRKNEPLFPKTACKKALQFASQNGIPFPQRAVIATKTLEPIHYVISREAVFTVMDYLKEQTDYYFPNMYEGKNVEYLDIFKSYIDKNVLPGKYLNEILNTHDRRIAWAKIRKELVTKYTGIKDITFTNHEISHAAYALHASPLKKDECLIVSIDGYGDDANCLIAVYERGKIKPVKRYTNFNIGRLYRYITLLLGMKPNEHEYKVMGLAPYAPSKYTEPAYRVFRDTWYLNPADGEIYTRNKPSDMYFYFRDKLQGLRFDTIAGGLQRYTEKMILDMMEYWLKKLNKSKIVYSGGVALNIKANKAVADLNAVADIYVPASGADESLCMGSIFAFLDGEKRGKEILPLENMYLGTGSTRGKVLTAVRRFTSDNSGFLFKDGVDSGKLARLIACGFVTGRYKGRMEFGARALGNRSILADPSFPGVVKKINAQIKKRDFWMPFTPSILDYRVKDYIINPKNIRHPFMTIAADTTSLGRKHLNGALHQADMTSRPQVVTREMNPDYWELIHQFNLLTGIGGLLNTSLNLSGLPICESPADALYVLVNSGLDMVCMEDCLVYRKKDHKKIMELLNQN